MKKPSIVLLRIGINLHAISSRTYIKIPPPLAFRSDLKILYPSMLNFMEENGSSNFISDIINTLTFPLIIAIKWLNLFLMESILMCPMIALFGCFFLEKLRCSELNSLLSEVLLTLLEEQTLSSDLLHPSGQFRLTISQQVKPFKYLTKLSRSLFKPFGFKYRRLLFKCFLWLMVVLLIKGISLLSHKSFK